MTEACWKCSIELRVIRLSAHSSSVLKKLNSAVLPLAIGSFAGAAGQQGGSLLLTTGRSMASWPVGCITGSDRWCEYH